MAQNGDTITILASAERTETVSAPDRTNTTARGIHVIIDVTAATATPSVVFKVEGKDQVSGKYYTLLESAAITGTGTTRLTIYPGAAATANVSVPDVLPKNWRVTATHADTDAITYSVAGNLVI